MIIIKQTKIKVVRKLLLSGNSDSMWNVKNFERIFLGREIFYRNSI